MSNVLIVGAGIGGLTLANALVASGLAVNVRIVEREPDPSAREQGYAITLTKSEGMMVLDRFGLSRAVAAHGKPVGEFRFTTARGRLLLRFRSTPDSRHARIAIARAGLRQVLRERLDPGVITWSSRCIGYRTSSTAATALFEDGKEISADLIVACDGARSSLREQMIGDQPHHVGLITINGKVDGGAGRVRLDCGSFMALGRGDAFFANTYGDGRIVWSYSFHGSIGELAGVPGDALRERVLAEVADWHAQVPDLVRATDPAVGLRGREITDRHPIQRASDGRVVLLGDACHPMTPYRGAGANQAMVDAISLVDALASAPSVEQAIARFEREMLHRSRRVVLASRRAARSLHETRFAARFARDAGFRLANAAMALVG